MRQTLIIVSLILTKISFSQPPANYKDIAELKSVRFLKALDMTGTFRSDVGTFEVITLELDSLGKFDNYTHSCDGTDSLDTGNWNLTGSQVILTGKKNRRYSFDVLQFGHYYILVPFEYKKRFISEMKSVLKKAGRAMTKEYDFPLYILDKLSVIVYFKKSSA